MTLLALSRLDRLEGMALVQGIAGGKPALLATIVNEIIDRADGVPLFIEELTKAVLESGDPEQADRTLAGVSPAALEIPTTLHASLMARFDRLGPRAKEVAQIGAAIGREFACDLLSAVAGQSDIELHTALEQLTGSGLVFCRGTPPAATFLFKHALVQDAAYSTLLRGRRRRIHTKIAEVLEQHFPQTVVAKPEVLARHCTEAGLAEKAVGYWHQAGQSALARSAATEAVTLLSRGLDVLQNLPVDHERHRREVALQVLLGQALIGAKGTAAPETGRAYARASELCRELGDVPDLLPALYGKHVFHFERGELARALEDGLELLSLARRRGDPTATVTGHRLVAAALCHLGRFRETRSHSEAGLALSDLVRDRTSCFTYALELARRLPKSAGPRASRAWLSRPGSRGDPSSTRSCPRVGAFLDARRSAGTRFQPPSNSSRPMRRPRACGGAVALATEQSFPLWSSTAMVIGGSVLVDDGRAEDGLPQMREGIAIHWATGADVFSPYLLALLASAHGRVGQAETGLARADDALGRVKRTGGRWFEAELHRIRGELLLVTVPPTTRRRQASAVP